MTVYKTIPGGFLIAFEGIDGSGKTTMARRAAAHFTREGYEALYLREPTDGPHGRHLREIMVSGEPRDPRLELELFLKDRREDVDLNITPLLHRGGIVCIDRYYISSMAYQGALGLDPVLIRTLNEEFAPVPDLILRYVVSIDLALSRIQATRPEGANTFEQQENLEKVNAIFEAMDFPQMISLDSNRDINEVTQETMQIILSAITTK